MKTKQPFTFTPTESSFMVCTLSRATLATFLQRGGLSAAEHNQRARAVVQVSTHESLGGGAAAAAAEVALQVALVRVHTGRGVVGTETRQNAGRDHLLSAPHANQRGGDVIKERQALACTSF
jgi:hypothetical protein